MCMSDTVEDDEGALPIHRRTLLVGVGAASALAGCPGDFDISDDPSGPGTPDIDEGDGESDVTVYQDQDIDFVAIGDSSMWGLGLNLEDKYANKFHRYLTGGDELVEERDLKAQTGAVIDHSPHEFILDDEFQRIDEETDGPTPHFDQYPLELCAIDKEPHPSLAEMYGRAETERFGRKGVPVDQPSVLTQIQNLPYDFDPNGIVSDQYTREQTYKATYETEADVDVVLMTGSINDLGATLPVMAPPGSDQQTKIDHDTQCYSFEGLKVALHRANQKFPNATIYVGGYFPPSSRESRLDEIIFEKALAGGGALASLLIGFGFAIPVVLGPSWILKEHVSDMNHRYEYYYKKMTFEMRKAVHEADREFDVPVLFGLPGFKRGNVPHVSSALEGLGPKVYDPVSYRKELLFKTPFTPEDTSVNPGDQSQERTDARYEVVDAYGELGILDKNASMHPNPAGTDQYQQVLESIHRKNFTEGWSLRTVSEHFEANEQASDDEVDLIEAFDRYLGNEYGLSPSDGLRACCNITKVDSMEVVIRTGEEGFDRKVSQVNFDVCLRESFATRRSGDSTVSEVNYSGPYDLTTYPPPPTEDEWTVDDGTALTDDDIFESVAPGTEYVARFNLNPHPSHPGYLTGQQETLIEARENDTDWLALDPIFDDVEIFERSTTSGQPLEPVPVTYNRAFNAEDPLYLWDIDGFRLSRWSWDGSPEEWDVKRIEIWINGMEVYTYEQPESLDIEENYVVLDLPDYPPKADVTETVTHHEIP